MENVNTVSSRLKMTAVPFPWCKSQSMNGGFFDGALFLENAHGDRQIVHVAKTLGLIGEGVVEPPGEVQGAASFERLARGEDGAARRQKARVDDLLADGKLARHRARGMTARAQIRQIFGGVDEGEFFFRRHVRLDKSGMAGSPASLSLAWVFWYFSACRTWRPMSA